MCTFLQPAWNELCPVFDYPECVLRQIAARARCFSLSRALQLIPGKAGLRSCIGHLASDLDVRTYGGACQVNIATLNCFPVCTHATFADIEQ